MGLKPLPLQVRIGFNVPDNQTPITEGSKPRGRPKGWRKSKPLEGKLPAMRIPEQLEEWLESEQERLGAASISAIARMKLMEMMRQEQKGG